MKRRLPLLLLTIALATALAACGPATPEQGGPTTPPGAGGSAAQAAGVTATPAPTQPSGGTAVKAGSTAAPKFRGSIVGGRAYVRSRVRYSWRAGCPVGPVELRLLRVDHWGLDGKVHRGELMVHRDQARRILVVLKKLFQARYPIQRLRLVDAYRADDDRSMAANNTSGFNCRRVPGRAAGPSTRSGAPSTSTRCATRM